VAWEQILGFFTMLLHPEITISLWAKAGVPIWQACSFAVLWTSGVLLLAYFGVGWLKRLIKKVPLAVKLMEKVENWYRKYGSVLENKKSYKKTSGWLIQQKNWIVLGCGFIPFVYGLPAAVIVAAKLMEIKHALFFLVLGNVFRNTIICYLIYQGFEFFS
jgi:hypothetical protein